MDVFVEVLLLPLELDAVLFYSLLVKKMPLHLWESGCYCFEIG